MSLTPPTRFHWVAFWFLCGFIVLLVLVSYAWLIPGLAVAADASPVQKQRLAALSILLLVVMLTIIASAMLLLFGVAKRVFPRRTSQRQKTAYPDAWAEAGRRLTMPTKDDSTHEP